MNTFKAGDKVYFPLKTTKICTTTEIHSTTYELSIGLQRTLGVCTTLGEVDANSGFPIIFHATQENKDLLEKLYGFEFESPPPKTLSLTLEIPEPFEPKLNEMYWYLDNWGDVGLYKFNNDVGDKDIKFKWRTKEEARRALNALNEFNVTFGIPR